MFVIQTLPFLTIIDAKDFRRVFVAFFLFCNIVVENKIDLYWGDDRVQCSQTSSNVKSVKVRFFLN